MKVMAILGSPRKRGNTDRVLSWVEEALTNAGHEVTRLNVVDRNIRGCIGCYECQKGPDRPGCILKDEGNAVFEEMMAQDAIVWGAPVYCWGFPSQMKALIDRGICTVTGFGSPEHRSLLEGKPMGLVATAAGPPQDNADKMVEIFRRVCGFVKAPCRAPLVVPYCTEPEALGREWKRKAREFAEDLPG